MILKIQNKRYDFFDRTTVNLRYDSVGSSFTMGVYFNPDNPLHVSLLCPCQFSDVVLLHNDVALLTGTLLNNGQTSGPVRELREISGYSKPGVLEDCEIPVSAYPLQANGLSLADIARKLCQPFGITVDIDPAVSSRANKVYTTTTARESQTVKQYLSELASQRNIIISHTAAGHLYLTEAATRKTPLYNFTDKTPGVTFSLPVTGRDMHSSITVIRQASAEGGNAGQSTVTNPYVSAYRPKVVRQSSGTDNDTEQAARNMLGAEIKAIKLTITLDRWEVDGQLLLPNNIITVQNEELFLNRPTRFFIESADLYEDSERQTATLTCVLPEVYNNDTPKNIFQ